MISISSSDKDNVLKIICENRSCDSAYSYDLEEFLKATDLNFEDLRAILKQFDRMGFISNLNMGRNRLFFAWHLEAYDYLQAGGFIAQEALIKTNIEKLLMEVEKLEQSLKPDHLEKANKIAGIASGILSGLTLWSGSGS